LDLIPKRNDTLLRPIISTETSRVSFHHGRLPKMSLVLHTLSIPSIFLEGHQLRSKDILTAIYITDRELTDGAPNQSLVMSGYQSSKKKCYAEWLSW